MDQSVAEYNLKYAIIHLYSFLLIEKRYFLADWIVAGFIVKFLIQIFLLLLRDVLFGCCLEIVMERLDFKLDIFFNQEKVNK